LRVVWLVPVWPVAVEVVVPLTSSRPAGLGMAPAGQQLGRVFGATAGQHPDRQQIAASLLTRSPADRHHVTQRSAASPPFILSGEPLRTI
jgi:hypothetical protein